MEKVQGIVFNLFSALTIIPSSLLVYFAATIIDRYYLLLLFATGNFIYIAASDLIPEIKSGEN
ncbi:MAG: hypothetical protein H3Z50_02080 [archaeon]|nr:hypothetical protein [archaeon]MCP8306939.1 hypothetical protein [archaeon]